MYGGFRGGLNWAPMMPRDGSLSDRHSYKSVRNFAVRRLAAPEPVLLGHFRTRWENGNGTVFRETCIYRHQGRSDDRYLEHHGSFPFDFEPNVIPFDSKSRRKVLPRSYSVQFGRNRKSFARGVPWTRTTAKRKIFCCNSQQFWQE